MIHPAIKSLLIVAFLHSLSIAQDRVHYTIDLSDPAHHLIQVTMEIPAGRHSHVLQLPVWNALYQIRDFSQHIDWIRAEDLGGHPLALKELNASRWLLDGTENGARIIYLIFANDPDPYGTQLNSHHAFLNLAEILIYAEDARSSALGVKFQNAPAHWKIATSLPANGSVFAAQNYDQLVDSPFEIGEFAERDFSANCGKYRVILDLNRVHRTSAEQESILGKLLPSIRKIVSAETAWMNDCPFHDYVFIYHSSDTAEGGGMEHAYSTAITLLEKAFTDNLGTFESTTAHEFFHLWNVKRIRPRTLEPVDYTRENYTRALWFSEGVDSTVAEYILLRAGLIDERLFFNHLAQEMTELEKRPARLTQSAEESSLDAWLEKYAFYRLPERSISYYNKGQLLGVLLDLALRAATDDHASLRELFHWMNERYAKQGKLFDDSAGVQGAAETISGHSFADFFRDYVSGTVEIPWDRFFSRVGLRVASTEVAIGDPGFEATVNFDQTPTVAEVRPGSEADRAGLKVGDAVLEINGETAGRDFERELENLAPGAILRLLVGHEGVKRQLQWSLGSRKLRILQFQDVPHITAEQKAHRHEWLFGDAEPRR